MNENNICITKCNNDNYIFHPFLGLMKTKPTENNICATFNFKDHFLKKCSINEDINTNIHNNIKTLINPTDYLQYYYKLNNLDDIIKYFKDNEYLLIKTKNRIFYFTIIKYIDNLENNIEKFIELIKIIFKIINDEKNHKIISILKKIKNKNKLKRINYSYNYLIKIKKYLDV